MQTIENVTIDMLLERYDVLLLDAYGVLVHATGAIPGAVELIDTLNRSGKTYYILTNDASKLSEVAAARYRGFGLPLSAQRIISSGSLLKPCFAELGLVGRPCVVLGPPDSRSYVLQAGGKVVDPDAPFDVLVVGDHGGFPFLETLDSLLTALFEKIDRGEKPALILPNPDLIFPKGPAGFGFAAGSVAQMLETALVQRYPGREDLRFVRLGKPQTALFEEALRRCGTRNMVMIGDQLATDIRGARNFGIDAALVTSGVAGQNLDLDTDLPRPHYLLTSIAPARHA